ncbi:MAG: amino acid ABC transporter permease [Christensenellales bacterium]|jgi:polar amino acid transport system permease protein
MGILRLFRASPGEKPGVLKAAFNAALVVAAIVLVFSASLAAIGVTLDFSALTGFEKRLMSGFGMTIRLSLASLLFSLLIGILAALGQLSRVLTVRYFCAIYIKFIRGTPLIMQIYLFFYIIGTAWGVTSRFWAGVIILSIFEGAYISEIVRGSLLSLDPTQLEAAKAVGFTRVQTARHVIIPQLMQRTLPALTGQFASIIKDSSLLSMIAVIELTQTVREITAINFRMFECYFVLGLLYLALTLPLSVVTKRIEGLFQYENRA